jgi:hypothetical protein
VTNRDIGRLRQSSEDTVCKFFITRDVGRRKLLSVSGNKRKFDTGTQEAQTDLAVDMREAMPLKLRAFPAHIYGFVGQYSCLQLFGK